jgi:hypothetical protein
MQSPQFELDQAGKPASVRLATQDYIRLFVEANITDSSLWPPGYEQGARLLERIREIEAECIRRYGAFDWELLPEALQDEYDDLCALLDRMQDTGERFTVDGEERFLLTRNATETR